jgi:hypothetical protein
MVRKLVWGIITSILVGVAATTLLRADTPPIIVTMVQAGVPGDARQEVIVIYNRSDAPVEVTGWCLVNKTSVRFSCFSDADDPSVRYELPARSSAVIASRDYAVTNALGTTEARVFPLTNQNSGSLVGSNDTLRLLDSADTEIDRLTWTASWPAGTVSERIREDEDGDDYATGWTIKSPSPLPFHALEQFRDETIGPCESDCPPLPKVRINEVLPNPAGVDTGNEFIEFFNEGDAAINLKGYMVTYQSSSVKSFTIPEEFIIEAQDYGVLSGTAVKHPLPNTHAIVHLLDPIGLPVFITPQYSNPKDGHTWAWFANEWGYSNQMTPGRENIPSLPNITIPRLTTSSLKPCTERQYRHPETNRCRNIETPAVLTACKEGQYRHPDTNRCRTIAQINAPAPCKEGQERNPETNRCRMVKVMTTVDGEVLAARVEEQPQQWYIVWAIIALIVALAAYGAWEWRVEVKRFGKRLGAFMIRSK